MVHFTIIEHMCDRLYEWHMEGRHLPNYTPRCGKPHLLWLFGIIGPNQYYVATLAERLDKETLNLLLGPHGWAFYRVLVIRREMKDENENMEIANACF